MDEWITSGIRQAFINRKIYLWLGPLYGFDPDSGNERTLEKSDEALAKIPWRAIFSDSPVPILEEAISGIESAQDDTTVFRSPLVIASPGHYENIDTSQFLPFYYLQGRLRARDKEDTYNALPEKRRQMFRSTLLLKLEKVMQEEGALVLLGFSIEKLPEVLEEARAVAGDTTPILAMGISNDLSAMNDGNLTAIPEDSISFIHNLEKRGLITPIDIRDEAHVLVGNVSVRIDDILQGPMGRIDESFRVVTVESLEPPTSIDMDLFNSFMVPNETRDAPDVILDRKEWRGFGSGLFINRDYKVEAKSLSQYLIAKLNEMFQEDAEGVTNITLQFPVEPGSGTTTLLHNAAYECGKEGFPSFVLKQDSLDVPIGQLATALTDLSQRARNAIKKSKGNESYRDREVPGLLIFDTQHADLEEVLEASYRLGHLGRKCLVLRAVLHEGGNASPDDSDFSIDMKSVRGKSEFLPVFEASLSKNELNRLQEHLAGLKSKHSIPILLRDKTQWDQYQNSCSFKVPGQWEHEKAESLFWVALYYFITSTSDDWTAGIQSCFSKRLHSYIDDPLTIKSLLDISRFSYNGLYVEWQLLGRLEGDRTSAKVMQRMRRLEADHLVRYRWVESSGSNLFRLRHKLLGRLFLQEAYQSKSDLFAAGVPQDVIPLSEDELKRPRWLLVHYLKTLDGSVPGDIQLAEEISEGALRIGAKRELIWDYRNDILKVFETINPIIKSSSRAINHHYAMALWKTGAYDDNLSREDKISRFNDSIKLLDKALKIPQRSNERDEHPGHILTSRAYVLWRWSLLVSPEEEKKNELESELITNFRSALKELPDNRYAQYGLARALIHICERRAETQSQNLWADMLLEALDLLQGDPSFEFEHNWLSLQEKAIKLIDESAPPKFREKLRNSKKESGFLLEAWATIGGKIHCASPEKVERAISFINAAIDDTDIETSWRAYYLAYKLMKLHPEMKNDKYKIYQNLKILDQMQEFVLKPNELYDLAVICYDLDRPKEGNSLLTHLRVTGRFKDISLDSQPFWTKAEPPFEPRPAKLRVKRYESIYKGWGFVEELEEEMPFRPAHFDPDGRTKPGDVLKCFVRFSGTGAKAVPRRFYKKGGS